MDRGEKQQLSVSKSSRHHRSNEWIFRDVPSDITLDVNGAIFSLHKFPLVSRSGRIRRVVAEHRDTEISRVELVNLPGGAEALELAAKFCYGVNFEITAANVAELLCVSDYLEMTEEHSKGNLASRAEEYLEGVVCRSLELSVEVLRRCESLTPLAEELRVVCRCVEGVAAKACAEQIASSFSRLEYSSSGRLHMARHAKSGAVGSLDGGDWWIEDISALRLDIYRQVIAAMKCRGVRAESIGASLVRYATKELSSSAADSDPERQLAVVETVVGLLPAERQAVPIGFLFGLLRTTTAASEARSELERRIGARLDEAALDDLLIPSSSRHHAAGESNTLFDVDAAHRIVACFSQRSGEESDESEDGGRDVARLGTEFGSECGSEPTLTAVLKVGRLVDSYLAEIAADSNLKLPKFVAIADALPPHARTLHDGLYRAIDIYLKAHGKLTETERRRLTKLIEFQRLSQEAGAHAAQNERLPLQSVVQVLYIEQVRLRNSVISDEGPTNAGKSAMGSPRDNYASLRRENRELKLELARLRMRLNDLERDHISMKRDYVHNNSSNSSNSLAANFLSSFSRKMGILGRRKVPRTASTTSPSSHSYRTDSKVVHTTCASAD